MIGMCACMDYKCIVLRTRDVVICTRELLKNEMLHLEGLNWTSDVVLCEQTDSLSLDSDTFDDPIPPLVKRHSFFFFKNTSHYLTKLPRLHSCPPRLRAGFPQIVTLDEFSRSLLLFSPEPTPTPQRLSRHAPPSLLFVQTLRTCQRRCIKPLQPVPRM